MKKILIAFILISIGLLHSQVLKIERIDSAYFPEIRVIFNILKDGKSLKGIVKDNIEFFFDEKPIDNYEFGTFFSTREWLANAILIDTSGSMRGDGIRFAKRAATDFLIRTGIQDKNLLISFSSKVFILNDFTKNKGLVRKNILSLKAGGNTSLYDAIALALKKIKDMKSPRKSIIVLTDGKDTSSKIRVEKLLELIKNSKAKIYTIGLGREINENILKRFSELSSGKYYNAVKPETLTLIYSNIAEELTNRYFVKTKIHIKNKKELSNVHSIKIYLKSNKTYDKLKFFPANISFGGGEDGVVNPKIIKKQIKKQIQKAKFNLKKLLPELYYFLIIGLILFFTLFFIFKPNLTKGVIILILIELFLSIVLILLKLSDLI